MPSITFWNRVEPRPRSEHLERHLAAPVRDPMFFLTRQYQFGEFQGEDAASPAFVELKARFAPITGWFAPGLPVTPFHNEAPLEELIQTEALTPNFSMAVELGQYYENLLLSNGFTHSLVDRCRDAYGLPDANDVDPTGRDYELRRFLLVCNKRAMDGIALWQAINIALPNLPAAPVLQAAEDAEVLKTLNTRFVEWVRKTFGDIGTQDAPAWHADQLEYTAKVTALAPDNTPVTLDAHPSRDGHFDWYSFDQLDQFMLDDDAVQPAEGIVEELETSMLPTNVGFPGMPNNRWWKFEDSARNFGELRASRLELGKIIVLDFMLVHGNDWYVIPFTQKVGSLGQIKTLLVHDVFGEKTLVEPADTDPNSSWSMYSIATKQGHRADYFMMSPSVVGASIQSDAVEEVRFMRDEMANMAWGIEKITENGIGRAWPGHERAEQLGSEPLEYRPAEDDAALKYLLQTRVPEHWIPLVPVQIDEQRREIALQRAAALRVPLDGGLATPIRPHGRVLNPTSPNQTPRYNIREEALPKAGFQTRRRFERARWMDGSTHLWVARTSGPGSGEGRSGLRFDQAMEKGK